jgi:membrane protein DedA with SNARE-associated domain
MEIFQQVIDWYMQNINYLTVFLLMMIESTFIPFPSEAIIPPAAWLAAKGELNIFGVVASGTAGALVGALINYYIGYTLGRKIIYSLADTKWAHLMMVNREKIEKAEHFFLKNGNSSTFIGRLVPVIRQLISLPAGVAKMRILPFILWTTLGAGIWNVLLALLGYFLYSQQELLHKYYQELWWGVLVIGVLFVGYLILKSLNKRQLKQKS